MAFDDVLVRTFVQIMKSGAYEIISENSKYTSCNLILQRSFEMFSSYPEDYRFQRMEEKRTEDLNSPYFSRGPSCSKLGLPLSFRDVYYQDDLLRQLVRNYFDSAKLLNVLKAKSRPWGYPEGSKVEQVYLKFVKP